MTLWTAQEAAAATAGTIAGDWSADGVSIDTRTLAKGDLFVALKAARDGHDFVAQALQAGAAAALVSRVPEGCDPAKLLIVDDVLKGLEDLGVAARARTQARVIAVTGSAGKTSTKEMLRDVLSPQGKTHAAEASYNNHWGVPLTLARMPQDTEYAVIEVGMSNPGEIAPLSRMARPHVAMITTVSAAHLAAFDDLAGIAREKATIMDGLGEVAVLNADLGTSDVLALEAANRGQTVIWFGKNAADYTLRDVSLHDNATVITAQHAGTDLLLKLNCVGRHFAMNALGVVASVAALGADPGRAAIDLGRWSPPAGRGLRERLVLDEVETDMVLDLLDDAFNANPASVTAALEVLAAQTPVGAPGLVSKGRRIAVLGDMLELGAEENALHAAIAEDPSLSAVTRVHCVGPRMQALYKALPADRRGQWFETAEACAAQIHHLIEAGDVVLVKGSKGSKVSLVVDAMRKLGHPFAPSAREG